MRVVLAFAVGYSVACAMPPGGSVSGTVRDGSGKPMPGVEVRISAAARLRGWVLPFAEPDRFVTATDELGHFGVRWSHGDAKEGPLLEVIAVGYAPAVASLGLGVLECDVQLVAVTATGSHSQARCRLEGRPKEGGS